MLKSIAILLVGGIHALAMTASASTTWFGSLLQIITMAALAAAVLQNANATDHSPLSSARDGFLFGLAWFTVGVGWVYISMHRYGGMHSVLAGLATLIFAAYLALYPAIACSIAHAWQRSNRVPKHVLPSHWSSLRFIAGFATAMTLLELARGYFFTGFPWISPGYAHIDSPLASIAPWGGVYAITWAASACAAAIAWIAINAEPPAVRFALPAIVLIASCTLPKWLPSDPIVQTSQPLSVTLMQGNVNQAMKFESSQVIGAIRLYLDQIEANVTLNNELHLFVLPETAWPTSINNMPDEIKDRFDQITRSGQNKIAIGLPHWHSLERSKTPSISNSVIVMGQKGSENYRYDKQHLVPFGEFIPTGFQWFIDLMQMPLGAFKRGNLDQPHFEMQGQKIAFNICYEDLFGEELASQTHQANLLINLSNIAWFDDSSALDQHLQIARMRVLETRKPMLRATNTGATVVIDADASVRHALPWISRGTITTSIKGTIGTTPYMRWTNLPITLMCGFVALILSAMTLSRRRQPA